MDHRHALETQAAERYLLGELSDVEAEAFELHYFECADCAYAVESGEMFISGVREHFDSPQQVAAHPGMTPGRRLLEALSALMRPAFTMPALATLLAILIYQNVARTPAADRVRNTVRPVTAVMLMSASRGEPTAVPVSHDSPDVILQALLPPGPAYPEYVCVILRGAEEISRSTAAAPAEGEPINLAVPAGQLPSGNYALIIYGQSSDGKLTGKLSEYPFAAQAGGIQPK